MSPGAGMGLVVLASKKMNSAPGLAGSPPWPSCGRPNRSKSPLWPLSPSWPASHTVPRSVLCPRSAKHWLVKRLVS